MVTNAAIASNLAPEPPKPPLKPLPPKPLKDGGARQAASGTAANGTPASGHAAASTSDWNCDSRTSISPDARALAARSGAKDARNAKDADKAGDAAASDAAASDAAAEAEALDPKEKQLKDLREWAKQVEREVRLQQHKILEQMLKQSGKDGDKNGSPFLMVTPDGVCARPGSAEKSEEAQVPEYWNAENTSDRIVHFATQMAEISGMDLKEFGEIIKEAVGLGFDQAGAATGELTGAAAKLNKDTKDLVFSKLSKWLEERAEKPYNQEIQKPAAAGAPDVAQGAAGTATGPG